MQLVQAYIKHRYSSKMFVITQDLEFEINLFHKKEICRPRSAPRTPNRIDNLPNYRLIMKHDFIKILQRKQIKISIRLQRILKIEIKNKFTYKLAV